MKSIYKYLIAVIVVGAIAFGIYNKVYIPKTTYKTIQASRGDISINIFGIGEVSAKTIYKVTAGVNGTILSLDTDEGLWVHKGDVIATIDSVDLPITIEEAKISVTKAQTELIALKKELESLVAQKHLAALTYKRYAKLKSQSFVSQSEFDKAKADLAVIQAQIDTTRAHIRSSKAEIVRVQKSVEALQEKLKRYTVIAPVNGYVIVKGADKGQSVGATQTLFEIVRPEDVWIKAHIDERISGDITIGAKAFIKLRSQQKRFEAYVKRIAPQSDPVTQEREVDVAFKNVPKPFYINEQAEVFIATKELHNVVLIPATALVYKDEITGVWIKQDNKAHFQQVQLLGISDAQAAIDGLSKNALLLIASTKNKPLKEGMKVH